jgi:hypothetical protein
VQGKSDMQTPTQLVTNYFEILDAPLKKLYLFEASAHIPMVEEKDKFLMVLDDMVKSTYLSGYRDSVLLSS